MHEAACRVSSYQIGLILSDQIEAPYASDSRVLLINLSMPGAAQVSAAWSAQRSKLVLLLASA